MGAHGGLVHHHTRARRDGIASRETDVLQVKYMDSDMGQRVVGSFIRGIYLVKMCLSFARTYIYTKFPVFRAPNSGNRTT